MSFDLLGTLTHYPDEEALVFRFETQLELTSLCTNPASRAGDRYDITLFGDPRARDVRATIKDLRKLDKDGSPVYKKLKSGLVPVYKDPPPLAYLEKVRGKPRYTGYLWVTPQFVTDCLILVTSKSKPVYVSLHEIREHRQRRIRSLSIQTTDPAEE
ncbi:MAG: hypothetical protein KDI55_09445 [Anaerolineae bacterium]|nr:hypothetical protein [Anaerolineae bacterium]